MLPPALLVLALLGIWELYVDAGSASSFVLPAPHAIASALWNNAGFLAANLAADGRGGRARDRARAARSASRSPWRCTSRRVLRRAVYPLAIGSQAVPIAVIAPLLVFWWGFGVFPKLVVIVLICFFPVLVTTVDGLAAVDPDQLKLLRTLDASRWQAFRFAELPAALPAALSGARIALAIGVIGAYIAESQTATTAVHAGLGREINADLNALQTPRAYAAAVRAVRIRGRVLQRARARRAPPGAVGRANREETPVESPPRPSAPQRADRAGRRCALALAACGAKQDVTTASAPKPFTVMLDWFPNADHAALYSAIAGGDFRAVGPGRAAGGSRRTGRTAEAARRGQGRRRDLLRARGAARARPG